MIDKAIAFARDTYRLMSLLRYNIYPRIQQETVAAHVAQVSLISLRLSEDLELSDAQKLKVMKMAVTHDLGETVDIPHILKYKYEGLKELLDAAELDEVRRLMPDEYELLFHEYEKGDCLESIVVKIADVISCKIYAEEELKLGNQYFNQVLQTSDKRLYELILKLQQKIGREIYVNGQDKK